MEVRVEWVIEMIAVLMGALNRLLAAFVPAHQVIQPVSASHTVKGFILLRGRCVGGSESMLLSYYIAVMRGCDVDRPRNLAKSVTVE